MTPSCVTTSGGPVAVTGSGWAEPQPPCTYHFFFRGNPVGTQPDGLFGPPNHTFTVPAGTPAGDHVVKCELRLNSNNQLLQCRQTPLKVVDSVKDPWNVTVTNQSRITIRFDPKDVCDVTPCKKIVFIQVDRRIGIKNDNTEVAEPDSNWGFDPVGDQDLTPDKYIIDRIIGKKEPYYGGNGLLTGGGTGSSTPGSNVATPECPTPPCTGSMTDTPSQSDGSFPAGFKGTRLEFETMAFCASGDDQGTYLGKVVWKWEKMKGGGRGTSTLISTSRDGPSSNFVAALNIWIANTNHPFTIPKKKLPTSGGGPCR